MINSRIIYDGRKRILLVDDRILVRDSIYAMLESGGYEVLAARNGPDGLTIFHRSRHRVDLLVTDCDIPGMTALELAAACARRDARVGVLFISGSEPNEGLQTALETPRRAFLLKPFRGEDLLRKVKELFVPGFDPEPVPEPQRLHLAPQLSR